ncbi:chaperonin 10-like protein [Melampsora americana]|nr:chaperonin 10-like protein [Melampsora americana]
MSNDQSSLSGQLNLSAVLYGPKDLRIVSLKVSLVYLLLRFTIHFLFDGVELESIPITLPNPHEVQLLIVATTLCGSDLHYYSLGKNGNFKIQNPLILGHESCGKIVKIGNQVNDQRIDLRVGQRVAIECGLFCKNCDWCDEGRYNLCEKMQFRSSAKNVPHSDGTLCQLINHPADLVHVVPDEIPAPCVALLEPLSVVMHAFNRLNISKESPSSVLVIGAGPIGIIACGLARSLGVKSISLIDIDSSKIDFEAKEMKWATDSWVSPRTSGNTLNSSKEISDLILERFKKPLGFDCTIECTGVGSCIQTGVYVTRSGGKLGLVGMGTPELMMPISSAALREVDIIGTFRYANVYPKAIKLLTDQIRNQGPLKKIEQLITHSVDLKEAGKGFKWSEDGRDDNNRGVMKMMISSSMPSDLNL